MVSRCLFSPVFFFFFFFFVLFFAGGAGVEGEVGVGVEVYGAFKTISLISSRSFIKGVRKPENPGKKAPDHP